MLPLRLLCVAGLVAACCASPQSISFGGASQRSAARQRFRQRPQGGDDTATRIGLVGGQLGNLDPVPGSDYPSRISNTNGQLSQQPQTQTNQGLRSPDDIYQQSEGRASQSNECHCSLINECIHNGFDGAGLIDIRIVNTKPTVVNGLLQCSNEFQELCCPPGVSGGGSGGQLVQGGGGCPAASYSQCGQRQLISVPGYGLKPAEASFGAYPWVATILRDGDVYISSGVLISDQWVLTVAHHVNKYRNNYAGLKIRFGEWDASDPNHEPCSHEERTVVSLVVHPQFDSGSLAQDVALLRLSQPLSLSAYPHINAACLPSGGQSFDYQRCWVAGFGKDAFGQTGSYSFIQKEVDVPVVPHAQCEQQLRQTRLGPAFRLNTRAFVCAGGEEGKDSCEGDGGAPLVCDVGGRWTVAGLVAWGIGCAEANRPGVYVNVASYSDWIQQQTGQRGR